MFDRNTIVRVIGQQPEMTTGMITRIQLWQDMLNGHAPWCGENIASMDLEKSICQEFSDIALSEMDVKITNDQLAALFEDGTNDLSQNLISGLACGSFVLKPVGMTGKTEFVTADKFVPISFDLSNKPDDIAFIDVKHVDENQYVIRLERHTLKDGALEITNTAYASSTRYGFDRIISLESVPEWAGLPEGQRFVGMDTIDFGYYRNPIKNEIDDTGCGVSVYDSAIDMIKNADIQNARLQWEFKSGERAVHVDDRMIKPVGKSRGKFTTDQLDRRLYRGMHAEDTQKPLFEVYSPEFRDANIINGLEQIYRQIERSVGLAYGDLSNVADVEKTATEIRNAKFRKYNRVHAIENNLRTCFEDYTRGLAFYNQLLHSGYEITVNFHDSVLTDEETERQQDRADLSAGIMQPYEYRMKWYDEDEATAKKMVNQPDDDVIE
ncbi:MAG: hypothetical protein ACI39G_02120 [Pseudoramibacter sp.]